MENPGFCSLIDRHSTSEWMKPALTGGQLDRRTGRNVGTAGTLRRRRQ
jgi:hypothetical protein